MTKMVFARPFQKFKLADEDRFDPAALLHLLGSKALSPATAFTLRQIRKRTFIDLKRSKLPHQRSTRSCREAIAGSRGIYKLLSFVIPEHQRIECCAANRVTAYDKFLSCVDPHLLPCPGANTGLVAAA